MNSDEVDNLIDKWHDSDSTLELYEYLGWTQQEYTKFVESSEVPQRINDIKSDIGDRLFQGIPECPIKEKLPAQEYEDQVLLGPDLLPIRKK